ncbi:hypothetical protein NC653_040436 [Populus alba x Populus x berolinensis]|uniref:non-specific serine/threonine protein kinase n=1 Tax=Populus alba x Populus x berolinensis TaxID=444605 RepID=A0AAD6PRN4_9ROSI|nr:hypothetical protein NC653_040436 [Populus alba x Populus x berolinensis]
MGICCSCSAHKPATTQDQDPTPSTADHVSAVFTLAQLRAATYNFRSDMVLGKGGFGDVYKGWLKEKLPPRGIKKTAVAVKKLDSSSMQGLKEWKAEVYFLGTHSHPNLVKLLGYCSESGERILVYEFMKKGSLNYHLFGSKIHLRPLFYNAKLSDFGLSFWGPLIDSHVSTRIAGTMGYIDPEYLATVFSLKLSLKQVMHLLSVQQLAHCCKYLCYNMSISTCGDVVVSSSVLNFKGIIRCNKERVLRKMVDVGSLEKLTIGQTYTNSLKGRNSYFIHIRRKGSTKQGSSSYLVLPVSYILIVRAQFSLNPGDKRLKVAVGITQSLAYLHSPDGVVNSQRSKIFKYTS